MSPIKIIDEGEIEGPTLGIYPLAGAFYTAFEFGGEEGFPTPQDLGDEEQALYAEARSRVCQAIAENRSIIEHDGGDDAVRLMLGHVPATRGSGQEIGEVLEAMAIRGQLAALYDQLNGVKPGMD